jgi:dinuclear metal center YbgI/SA1388 family protein
VAKPTLTLSTVIGALEAIAPLQLAEPWDNVGLLVEPATERSISTILLTIDLVPQVLAEAEARGAELVVAYHPPLFQPMTRIVRSDPRGKLIAAALERGIAIYSPHTALDAAPGGVNDWLADAFPSGLRRALAAPNARIALAATFESPPLVGQGRLVVLDEPISLADACARLKKHLGLRALRVAAHDRHRERPIETIALCAGAGGDVVAGSSADLYVTGEMSHHKVLAALAAGASVVLSEHSHTERGYLPSYARRLEAACSARVLVAKSDRDPLEPL